MAVSLPPSQGQAILSKKTKVSLNPASTNLYKTVGTDQLTTDQLTLRQRTQKVALSKTEAAANFGRKYFRYLVAGGVAIAGAAIYHKWPVSAKLMQQHGDKLVSSAKQATASAAKSATPISTALQEAKASASSVVASATSRASKILSSEAASATDKMAKASASASSIVASATSKASKILSSEAASATDQMAKTSASASSAAASAISTISEASSGWIKDKFAAVTAHPYSQKVFGFVPSRQSVQNQAGKIVQGAGDIIQEHPLKTTAGIGVGAYLLKGLLDLRGLLSTIPFSLP